jgi:ABC-2 type transport system permease protein
MPSANALVLARHELRLFRREPGMLLQMIFMPIVMIAFLKPAFGPALAQAGFDGATGAEQAVPGMIVMFSFFGAGMVGFAFFREHGWGTWDRLRASRASAFDIVVGKAVPTFVLVIVSRPSCSWSACGCSACGSRAPSSVSSRSRSPSRCA